MKLTVLLDNTLSSCSAGRKILFSKAQISRHKMLNNEFSENEKFSIKMPGHARKIRTKVTKNKILRQSIRQYFDDGSEADKLLTDANVRERLRTHSVNSALSTLRTLIPTEPANRKLSKIEILRLACSYIKHLGTTLEYGDEHPCLLRGIQDNNTQDTHQERSVCTFCLANHKRASRTPHQCCSPDSSTSTSEQQQAESEQLEEVACWSHQASEFSS
ncbi:Hypothetical predicted protein [Cloeon dipterum]|uniref:BHLH domain-containing protein n=2 Tax=Cloeon dipterum TaxID=197152 RepID=A0A8S1BTE1_9INSE|nr:Hypothetical predicted protein [Cloeon dipterum]